MESQNHLATIASELLLTDTPCTDKTQSLCLSLSCLLPQRPQLFRIWGNCFLILKGLVNIFPAGLTPLL